MEMFVQISGWLGAILLAPFVIPQIIKSLKTKSAIGVKLGSIWILNFGSLLWVLHAGIVGVDMIPSGVSNLFVLLSNNILFSILYFYNKKYSFVSVIMIFLFTQIIFWFGLTWFILLNLEEIVLTKIVKEYLGLIFSIVAGVFTSLAFLPQARKTFNEKNVQNLSLILFLWGFLYSLIWTIFFLLIWIQGKDAYVWVAGLIFSLNATLIYFIQVVLIIKYHKPKLKNHN